MCLIEWGERQRLYDVRKLLAVADDIGMPRKALLPVLSGQPDGTLEADDIDHSDYNETVGSRLLAVTGELGGIAGWVAFDHGDPAHPETTRYDSAAKAMAK